MTRVLLSLVLCCTLTALTGQTIEVVTDADVGNSVTNWTKDKTYHLDGYVFVPAGGTLNIYSQIALVTLIGLITKHGILITEFANQLRLQGKGIYDAIVEAAALRLRPILMTSAALIVAMVPLLTASGPGAVSRFDIGLTIVAGLGIGTLFTLFVLPAFYLLLARDHSQTQGAQAEIATDLN